MVPHILAAVIAVGSSGATALSTVTGRVTLGGPMPPQDVTWVTKGGDCPRLIPDDRFRVAEDRSLGDSVVTLLPEPGTRLPMPDPATAARGLGARDAEVRALYCALAPRVQFARPGSLLLFTEEPRSGHRLHAYRDGTTLWAQQAGAAAPLRALGEPGVVDVRCDAGHEWEVAWVYVTDAPFVAVTGADGRFSLSGVPGGAYTLRAWHPYLGHVKASITVNPEAPSGLVVNFSGRGIVETLYPEVASATPATP